MTPREPEYERKPFESNYDFAIRLRGLFLSAGVQELKGYLPGTETVIVRVKRNVIHVEAHAGHDVKLATIGMQKIFNHTRIKVLCKFNGVMLKIDGPDQAVYQAGYYDGHKDCSTGFIQS